MLTMEQLIIETEKALYQSAGSAVQTYSQDILMQNIQQAFNFVFRLKWWPHLFVRETVALDGITGLPTTDFVHIKRYEDIRWVFNKDCSTPLPKLPIGINPYSLYAQTGDRPLFIESHYEKILKVWPETATGSLVVAGKKYYEPFKLIDIVPFDETILIHYAAWSYFVGDGSNPDEANKHKGLWEEHLKQLENHTFNENILLDPHYAPIESLNERIYL